jgi:hypothetical protein
MEVTVESSLFQESGGGSPLPADNRKQTRHARRTTFSLLECCGFLAICASLGSVLLYGFHVQMHAFLIACSVTTVGYRTSHLQISFKQPNLYRLQFNYIGT